MERFLAIPYISCISKELLYSGGLGISDLL